MSDVPPPDDKLETPFVGMGGGGGAFSNEGRGAGGGGGGARLVLEGAAAGFEVAWLNCTSRRASCGLMPFRLFHVTPVA